MPVGNIMYKTLTMTAVCRDVPRWHINEN